MRINKELREATCTAFNEWNSTSEEHIRTIKEAMDKIEKKVLKGQGKETDIEEIIELLNRAEELQKTAESKWKEYKKCRSREQEEEE